MASKSFQINTCDRCKKEEHSQHTLLPDRWGKVFYVQNNVLIYTQPKPPQHLRDYTDLCESCLIELDNWFRRK